MGDEVMKVLNEPNVSQLEPLMLAAWLKEQAIIVDDRPRNDAIFFPTKTNVYLKWH